MSENVQNCITTFKVLHFFSKNTSSSKQKYILRRTTTLDNFYGNFRKKWRIKKFKQGFLLYRAIDKPQVKKNLNADQMILLLNMK